METEDFWAGEFGDSYIDRNRDHITNNLALFLRVLSATGPLRSVIELGANIGLNLQAIHQLSPKTALSGIEINLKAFSELSALPYVTGHHQSILSFQTNETWDLAFTKGVLIHIAPDDLPNAYDTLHRLSRHYILLVEYYNPSPVEVDYRGYSGKLFKRDFAGEMLDRFPDLKLTDYGFIYRRDLFPQDDLTWFLLRKT